ncbi:hypothetical protein BH09MYX1_BH09MYX1_20660 [soil metagenome]
MRHSDDTPPSSLRGRLCEVFFPALLEPTEGELPPGAQERTPLLTRLGDKAQLDEPLFGASAGLTDLRAHLAKLRAALLEVDATYVMERTVRGADRDVTEGTLEVRLESGRVAVPAAVAMSRGRNREVSLRLYFAPFSGAPRKGPAAPPAGELPAAADVRTLLASEAFGSEAQLGQLFETNAVLRDESGKEHDRAELLARLAKTRLDARGCADDLRTCALELAARSEGAEGGELVVLTRGESGLFREARWYA